MLETHKYLEEIQSEYGGIATFVLINKSSNPITITNWVSDGRGG